MTDAPIARRAVLAAIPLLAARRGSAGAMVENLVYRDGRLSWPGGGARAAEGWGGVRIHKHEGDGGTPAGTFPLVSLLYRADRVATPRSMLPGRGLAPDDGWVDDPADPNYNRLVVLPYPAHAEAMWRRDHLYDVVVVIGYNVSPVVPGRGSAIFLHVARADFAKTEGCIAVDREVLLNLLPRLGPGSTIAIHPSG